MMLCRSNDGHGGRLLTDWSMTAYQKRGERSSSQYVDYVVHMKILAVPRFLDRNFRYKFVATQIPTDAEFTFIPYTVLTFLSHKGHTNAARSTN